MKGEKWRKIHRKTWKGKGSIGRVELAYRYNYKNKNRNFKASIKIRQFKAKKKIKKLVILDQV